MIYYIILYYTEDCSTGYTTWQRDWSDDRSRAQPGVPRRVLIARFLSRGAGVDFWDFDIFFLGLIRIYLKILKVYTYSPQPPFYPYPSREAFAQECAKTMRAAARQNEGAGGPPRPSDAVLRGGIS